LGLDAITEDTHIQDCAYCMFSLVGYGNSPGKVEAAMLVTCGAGGRDCRVLPFTNEYDKSSQKFEKPKDFCAYFHTHPRTDISGPSDNDKNESKKPAIGVPFYVVHPTGGITKYDPKTGVTKNESGPEWMKGAKKRCKKPCDGIPR